MELGQREKANRSVSSDHNLTNSRKCATFSVGWLDSPKSKQTTACISLPPGDQRRRAVEMASSRRSLHLSTYWFLLLFVFYITDLFIYLSKQHEIDTINKI